MADKGREVQTGVVIHGGPVVERARRGRQEAGRDRALLWWVGRFRFVTAEQLSVRFGVSEQRVNARVRRLLGAGLLGEHRPHVSARRIVYLSRRGAREIGVPPRRAPRAELQIRHELAIASLVAHLEAGQPVGESRVWTERECRQAERREGRDGKRWSVDVYKGIRREQRWPDLVLQLPDGRRRAIEIEFAVKHTKRLEDILQAYATSLDVFEDVLWLVERPRLAERIRELAAKKLRWAHQPAGAIQVAHYTPDDVPPVLARRRPRPPGRMVSRASRRTSSRAV